MKRILITACDAGSGNFFLPLLESLSGNYLLLAEGVALDLFKKKGVDCASFDSAGNHGIRRKIEPYFNPAPELVLCGTSWGEFTVDKIAILEARKRGIPSISVVEHWSMYRERFCKYINGNPAGEPAYYSDTIWVNDEYARQEAHRSGIPFAKLEIAGQTFLEQKLQQLKLIENNPKSNMAKDKIVFLSERIRDDFEIGSSLDRGYDEYEALELLLKSISLNEGLLIKLHPQEPPDKYQRYLELDPRIEVLSTCDLNELFLGARKIVGMESMALLEAALIRADVISFTPRADGKKFIGNRLGATLHASEVGRLKECLRSDQKAQNLKFGEAFLGSKERVLKLIEAHLNKA